MMNSPIVRVTTIVMRKLPANQSRKTTGWMAPVMASTVMAATLPIVPSTAMTAADAIQLSGKPTRAQIHGPMRGINTPSSAAMHHEKRNVTPKLRSSCDVGVAIVAPLKAKTTAIDAMTLPAAIRSQYPSVACLGRGSISSLLRRRRERHVHQPWHFHRRRREATARRDAARQRRVELDRDLRRRTLHVAALHLRRVDGQRRDGEYRTRVVLYPRQRPVGPAGATGKPVHQLAVHVAVVPVQHRLLVLEPGEDHVLAAARARGLDAEHAG